MPDETDAIIRATVQRFRAIATQYSRNQMELDQLYQEVDALNAKQSDLQQLANRCYSAADLFGFDLAAELAKATPTSPAEVDDKTAIAELPRPAAEEADTKRQTVKDFILERARLAYPKAVRASDLRRAYEEVTGRAVHDKTFGMSLYRLSLDGAMKREGPADWYYVTDESRVPTQASAEAVQDLF